MVAVARPVRDPAEAAAVRHADREWAAAARHGRREPGRLGDDAERRGQHLALRGLAQEARQVAEAGRRHGLRRSAGSVTIIGVRVHGGKGAPMTIAIKDWETEALLDEIRTATGKEVGDILCELACQEAERNRSERELVAKRERIDAITRRYASRLGPNPPTPDEIIGYDEHGLPR